MAFIHVTIDELLNILDQYNHNELHVHHTWKPTHKGFTGKNHQAMQQAMKDHHTNKNGWQDIGQHATLFPDGTFLLGRPFNLSPASITGFNTGAFAVEMVGNFDSPGTGSFNSQGYDKLEGKQLDSIIRLAKYFDDKKKYVRFHRENAPKTCPGTGIDKAEFMKQVRSYGVKPTGEGGNKLMEPWVKELAKAAINDYAKKGYINSPDTWLAKLEKGEDLTPLALDMINKLIDKVGDR